MRNLAKLQEPSVLAENAEEWTDAFVADPTSRTARFRYRHADIKAALREETGNKCIYCESMVGHNTPGDVEHKVPTDADSSLHFSWTNLTLACAECNRRKNAYFDSKLPFLDPYSDDVEAVLIHLGPIVNWRPGQPRAEMTVRRLALNGSGRPALVTRKIEKIQEVNDAVERYHREKDPVLRTVLRDRLQDMCRRDAEYSAMVMAVVAVCLPSGI
jgi:uncharacterized protein (TIGR02646 family)